MFVYKYTWTCTNARVQMCMFIYVGVRACVNVNERVHVQTLLSTMVNSFVVIMEHCICTPSNISI